MAGSIVDAQSRYNLRNLAQNGVPSPSEIAVFQRLLIIIKLDPNLAQATADAPAATQKPAAAQCTAAESASASAYTSEPGKTALQRSDAARVTHNDDRPCDAGNAGTDLP